MTEKERRLYFLAGTGAPISDDFFTEFPDANEVLPLAMALAIRRLTIIVASSETPAKDVIPAARLLFALNGKDVDSERGEVIDGERIMPELQAAMSRIKP
jgi:hypothetical protein